MIVRNVETGWEIVFQPSHGLLAMQLAQNLDERYHSPRWWATCAAIGDHDDDQADFTPGGSEYISDVGVPLDFTQVETSSRQRFQKTSRRITNAYRKDRWVGLLTSMHAEFLYGDEATGDDMANLIRDEKDRRRQVLRHLHLKIAELRDAYETLRWCDRCSLILAQSQIPAMQRRLEIITTKRDGRSDIWQDEAGIVRIDPWPFAKDSFEVGVDVYCIDQLKFADDAELNECLSKCQSEYRKWQLERR